MSLIKCLASFCLAAINLPTLHSEQLCPGNVASLPFRFTNRHQIVLAVSINHTGPFQFLLDSGTQITLIDPSVAVELHLDIQGTAVIAGAASRQSAPFAQLDLVEAGSHAVAGQRVLVYDLKKFDAPNLHIQGILGEDFLEHFDMMIDNRNRLLCLDRGAAMRADVKGPHIPLVAPAEPDGIAIASLVIIAARLSYAIRPVRLLLDSGANAPLLYNISPYIGPQISHDVPLRGSGVDGEQQLFSALPLQDVEIASLKLSRVAFFSLAGIQKDARLKGFDGVLPTGLFQRVFIDHADGFVILDPK
jgi:hypothetical protein